MSDIDETLEALSVTEMHAIIEYIRSFNSYDDDVTHERVLVLAHDSQD